MRYIQELLDRTILQRLATGKDYYCHLTSPIYLELILKSNKIKTHAFDESDEYHISLTHLDNKNLSKLIKDIGACNIVFNEKFSSQYHPTYYIFSDVNKIDYAYEEEFRVYDWIEPLDIYVKEIRIYRNFMSKGNFKRSLNIIKNFKDSFEFNIVEGIN